MSDEPVPSDFDISEMSSSELNYGWSLLIDLRGEFEGSTLVFSVFAILAPLITILSILFEWGDRGPELKLFIGAALTIACLTVAIHSWIWFFWFRKRLRMVEKRIRQCRDQPCRS